MPLHTRKPFGCGSDLVYDAQDMRTATTSLNQPMTVLAILIATFGFCQRLHADDAHDRKIADIRRLIDLSGGRAMGEIVTQQMLQQLRSSMPNVPAEIWSEMEQEISAQSFIDLVVPIYDRHFTHEDVLGLIEFYESPIGRKYVQAQTGITQDSMMAGQKLAQQIMASVEQKLRDRKKQ